jgi:hypothetical protein
VQTIAERVLAAGANVGDDELVNFGRIARGIVDPTTGRRSYWFRYGDIKQLTLVELQILAVGQMASAGQPSGANVMRVSALDQSQFSYRDAINFAGICEYTIDMPVPVWQSVPVGP